ncbi:hypothetical protein GXW82_07045 [Streptacidiphilus sp. 4-A2]|nr:hypothetical protein [Streptacidiphilus sp. 4-A2]
MEPALPVLDIDPDALERRHRGGDQPLRRPRRPSARSLFRTGAASHTLVLVLHHIAGDGWSLAPLVRDLGAAYRDRMAGSISGQPQLAVQYADYALWQRAMLGDETDPESVVSRQLSFWEQALAEAQGCCGCPGSTASGRGGQCGPGLRLHPGAGAARPARELAMSSNSSLFMVLQAAVATLLCRHGAGEDIPLGSPVAGRTDAVLEDMVGFFVNTLVLRTDLSGDPTFRELLSRVREFDLAAYAHQDLLPFERLVEHLNPVRARDHHPLFQTMLVLQNQETAAVELPV